MPPQLRHLSTALRAVGDLRRGDSNPETLHRLRTHLRRLQAYLELIGDSTSAKRLGNCVSESSRLRALQVFEAYLSKRDAPQRDLRQVRARVKARQKKLLKKDAFRVIEDRLREHAMPIATFEERWLSHRLDSLRQAHAEALRLLYRRALKKPRRKLLHRIRLSIKTIRYQEEWVLDSPFGRPLLLEGLKRIQSVLGAYEDCAQFRKWARAWSLSSRPRIQKDWRLNRRRACAVARKLDGLIERVASRRLWLVPRPTQRLARTNRRP